MSTPRQIDLARRAQRGERALTAAGYLAPSLAPIQPTMDPANAELSHALINLSSAGVTTLIGANPGQSIYVYAVFLWSEGAQTLEFLHGANTLTGPLSGWPAAQGLLFPFVDEPYFKCDPGAPFVLSMSAAAQVSGFCKFRMV